MDVNIGRMKKWDWGVLAAFVVAIVGVSIPWWKTKFDDLLGGLPPRWVALRRLEREYQPQPTHLAGTSMPA